MKDPDVPPCDRCKSIPVVGCFRRPGWRAFKHQVHCLGEVTENGVARTCGRTTPTLFDNRADAVKAWRHLVTSAKAEA